MDDFFVSSAPFNNNCTVTSVGDFAEVRSSRAFSSTKNQRQPLRVMIAMLLLAFAGIQIANSASLVDESFDAGEGAPGQVSALAMQPDGKILVGGFFTSFNGIQCDGIVRLN